MAILSNINDLFRVDSAGAVYFATSAGANLQVLQSVGTGGSPIWVDVDDIIGGPYLPLAGGTLTGNLALTDATNNPSLVISTGSLTVGGATTLNAALTGTSAVFTSDAGVTVYTATAGVGANITFSDVANRTQLGSISYFHLDTASYGSGNAFVITGDQATMTILADGKLMYKEGVYLKPATGTGAGTRKDNLWDAAYNDKITALAVAGTTTKTLTATQQDGGTLTASWTDNDSGGTVTGTGANTQVAFWTGTSVIDGSSSLKWDNTNFRLGIGITPTYALDIYNSSGTTSSATGTTMQRLWNYVGADLSQQKTFIDFVFQDGNDNEYPQVRIGAEVGQNADADTTIKEGSGAFVVYTNNATGSTPGTNSLTERMRVDYAGNVGIGTSTPGAKLNVVGNILTTGYLYWDANNSVGQSYVKSGGDLNLIIDSNNNQTSAAFIIEKDTQTPGSGTEIFRVQEDGNAALLGNMTLGVGTLSIRTDALLTLNAGNSFSGLDIVSQRASGNIGGLRFFNSTNTPIGAYLVTTTGVHNWYAGQNASVNMTIIANGNVGIRNTLPGFSLDVYSPTTNVVAQFESGDNQAWISVRDDGYTTYGAMLGCDNDLGLEVILANNAATKRLVINNSGEVGIGENSPADKLDVNGAILCNNRVQIDGVDDAGNVTGSLDSLRATGYGLMGNRTGNIYITNGNSATGAQIVFGLRGAHNGNNKLVIGDTVSYFNNNVVLINKTVNHGGQLQVGTTATSGSIRIGGGNGTGESRVYIESNGNDSYIDSFGGSAYQNLAIQAAVLSFQTSGSTARSVGMGSATWRGYGSNPIAKLNIEVAGGNALNIYNTSENEAYLRFIDSQSNGSQYAYFSFSSGSGNPFIINNMGANAFYIAGDGYGSVGMGGAPNTGAAGDRLKITGGNNGLGCIKAISGQYSYAVKIEGSNLSTQLICYSSSTAQTTQINFENPGNSSAGKISTTGNSTAYTTSSDYRLKENVIPISDSIYRLNQLKPSRFNFIGESNKTVDGFIAHEVQDIVPEAIVGEKDEIDKDGNPVHQAIDQAKLVPLLVAAIQELEARVKELENK